MVWLIVIVVIAAAAVALVIRNSYELKHLRVTEYSIRSPKITGGNALRAVFISDLHGWSYGEENSDLLALIKQQNPDVIFIGGDIFNAGFDSRDEVSYSFLKNVSEIAKVYFAPGNHENLMRTLTGENIPEILHAPGQKRVWHKEFFVKRMERFDSLMQSCGITCLENNRVNLNENITVQGLDLEMKYYKKVAAPKPDIDTVNSYLGSRDENKYNILLAHSPEFFDLYAQYGSDLVLSGHYHGGTVRLPVVGGVMSPRGIVFPKYSWGRFKKKNTTLIVTAGCGQHHVNLRLGNRPEIVVLDIGDD